MKLHLVVFAGLLALTSPVFAAEKVQPDMIDGRKIELARYTKSYIGPDNVSVDIAHYKMDNQNGAILLIKGVEGPWDGKAINHDVKPASREGKDYVTRYKGQAWHSLVTRKDYDTMTIELYVPEVKEAIKLAPSDGAAQLITPQAILKEYQAQNAKGASK